MAPFYDSAGRGAQARIGSAKNRHSLARADGAILAPFRGSPSREPAGGGTTMFKLLVCGALAFSAAAVWAKPVDPFG
jgi:hypothetical protein